MSLMQSIKSDTVSALKAGDKDTVSVLRMAQAALTNYMFEKKKKELDDKDVIDVLQKQAKLNKESLESYEKAGRKELADKERKEFEVLQKYLPKQLTPDEIKTLVQKAIAESGARSADEMGKVMKVLMPEVKGKADGKTVNQIVQELLKK